MFPVTGTTPLHCFWTVERTVPLHIHCLWRRFPGLVPFTPQVTGEGCGDCHQWFLSLQRVAWTALLHCFWTLEIFAMMFPFTSPVTGEGWRDYHPSCFLSLERVAGTASLHCFWTLEIFGGTVPLNVSCPWRWLPGLFPFMFPMDQEGRRVRGLPVFYKSFRPLKCSYLHPMHIQK